MATSIVVTSTAVNIADFARYYNILHHMERLKNMIERLKIQLRVALTMINDVNRHFENTISELSHENNRNHTTRSTIKNCLEKKKKMILTLLNTSVLSPSTSDKSKSVWFIEFEDLIQLDESKAYIPGRSYDKTNLVEVTVFFRSLTQQTITQTSSCTIWMLLSEIGGTMGMYLGATVITGFELVLFVCNLRRKKFCKFEQQLDQLDCIHRRRAKASVIMMKNIAEEESCNDV